MLQILLAILSYTISLALCQSIAAPSLVPGTADFALIGCYSELHANPAGRALGVNGEYINPLVGSSKNLTVQLCLDSCRDSAGLLTSSTPWTFAAVENERSVVFVRR